MKIRYHIIKVKHKKRKEQKLKKKLFISENIHYFYRSASAVVTLCFVCACVRPFVWLQTGYLFLLGEGGGQPLPDLVRDSLARQLREIVLVRLQVTGFKFFFNKRRHSIEYFVFNVNLQSDFTIF